MLIVGILLWWERVRVCAHVDVDKPLIHFSLYKRSIVVVVQMSYDAVMWMFLGVDTGLGTEVLRLCGCPGTDAVAWTFFVKSSVFLEVEILLVLAV